MTIRMERIHQPNWAVQWLKPAFKLIHAHRRAYLWLNGIYYGLIVLGMIYAMVDPGLQKVVMDAVGTAFSQGPMAVVGDAYLSGQTIRAILLTFGINLVIGSGATITLPSLIIPFSGLVMGAYRAFLWGLIYAPTSPELRMIFFPHLLTLLLEGQAYVLVLLATVIQGRALLSPHTVDTTTRRQGYWRGIKLTLQLYGLVLLILAVAAVYEGIEAAILLAQFG